MDFPKRSSHAITARRTAVYAAMFGLLIYAFVALAGPALEPDEPPLSPGTVAAATSLTDLVAAEPTQAGPTPEERLARGVLSNGCSYTPRGIPRCGVLLGAAYGGNTDPLAWERSMGHPLGVRRTYWAADQVDVAVSTARRDLRLQRLPWISFKLPYSWEQMRDGRGDGWARALAAKLSQLDGPVWLAFHHEPEGDGDLRAWTGMQARLAPIVRETAPNVAYSIILTGLEPALRRSHVLLRLDLARGHDDRHCRLRRLQLLWRASGRRSDPPIRRLRE